MQVTVAVVVFVIATVVKFEVTVNVIGTATVVAAVNIIVVVDVEWFVVVLEVVTFVDFVVIAKRMGRKKVFHKVVRK